MKKKRSESEIERQLLDAVEGVRR